MTSIPVPSSTSVRTNSTFSSYTKAGSNLSLNITKDSALSRRRAVSLSPKNGRHTPTHTSAELGASSAISMNRKQSTGSFRSLLPRPKSAQRAASVYGAGSNVPSYSNMNSIATASEDTMTLSQESQNDKKLAPASGRLPSVDSDAVRRLTRTFIYKRRDFLKMKRDLIAQQKAALDAYASLKELEKKAKDLGLNMMTPAELEEMQVVDVGAWSGFDLRLLTNDQIDPNLQDLPSEFGGIVLREMSVRLKCVPEQVQTLCNDLLTHQREQFNILRSRVIPDKIANDNWKKSLGEIVLKSDKFEGQVNGVVANLKVKMDHVLSLTKIAWKDRDDLIKKLEKIKRELHATQRKLKEGGDAQAQVAAAVAATAVQENNTTVEEVRAQLTQERIQRESLKALVSNADGTLRVARARIGELERELKDSLTELEQARRKQKDLEQQIRHRENSFEVRTKKLKEATKCGESTIEILTKQRDSLEIRVKELNGQLESVAETANRRFMEEHVRCASLEARGDEQQRALKDLEERLRTADEQLISTERTWEDIHERCDQLMQLHEERRANLLPQDSVAEASDREVELWKELQTTRMTLGRVKEEARKARREKEQFLQQLSKIAQNYSSESARGKIAEEFIEKERAYDKLQDIVSKLQKSEEIHEQRESTYKKRIGDLQMQVLTLRNYDVGTTFLPGDDLEIEMMELQMEVSTLRSERAALQSAAAASELLLERHQRATEVQRRALRLRDELLQMLNARAPLPPEKSVDDKLSSLSSVFPTSDCPQTWSVLQQERVRMKVLERKLCAQHDQLKRESSERTRLEGIRAQLERKLSHITP